MGSLAWRMLPCSTRLGLFWVPYWYSSACLPSASTIGITALLVKSVAFRCGAIRLLTLPAIRVIGDPATQQMRESREHDTDGF